MTTNFEGVDLTKPYFSTGEVAKILQCSKQTAIRIFVDRKTLAKGEKTDGLIGFLIPGSTWRRIPAESLWDYMTKNDHPFPAGFTPPGDDDDSSSPDTS